MVYFDHNATTPVREEVLAAMLPYWRERAGNPSSVHGMGRAARTGLDTARRQVAAAVEVHESQVIFTSGGTEANNLALMGVAASHGFRGHLLVGAVEHPSVLEMARSLERRGMELSLAGVGPGGRYDPEEVASCLRPDTRLVSLMLANNETGVLQPVAEVARLCRERDIPCHSDAVQAFGREALSLADPGVDLLSLSAHKIGGPKGVGALIVTPGLALEAMLLGGGQERGRRSGTENLAGIVGFGQACILAMREREAAAEKVRALRNHLEERLGALFPEMRLFGREEPRLPNTVCLSLPGIDGEMLVMALDMAGFCISSGSACSSGKTRVSHVLAAMGVEPALASGAIRLSLGSDNRQEEVEGFVEALHRIVQRLLRTNPFFSPNTTFSG
ncbi:MAG: cysteine desulfurase [Magnetococcales bacterium]|nr:cysteine desulfurase [Magnetococcales bacterium]